MILYGVQFISLEATLRDQDTSMKTTRAERKRIKDLLDYFGLSLTGLDPGVMARRKDEGDRDPSFVVFNTHEWDWIEPLLIELRHYRNDHRDLLLWQSNNKNKK